MKTKSSTRSKPVPKKTRRSTSAKARPPGAIKLKTILVPLDLSDESKKALRYAAAFAREFGGKLLLAHVVEPPLYPAELGYTPIEYPRLEGALSESAARKLEQIRRGIAGSTPAEAVVLIGPAFHSISRLAQERKADLIVVTTHGYTGLKHVLLGSTAEKIVRHAPCPVLVVREKEREFV